LAIIVNLPIPFHYWLAFWPNYLEGLARLGRPGLEEVVLLVPAS